MAESKPAAVPLGDTPYFVHFAWLTKAWLTKAWLTKAWLTKAWLTKAHIVGHYT